MVNYKKIDYKDFVFIQRSPDEKEEKEFSDFLKRRKSLKKRAIRSKNSPSVKAA